MISTAHQGNLLKEATFNAISSWSLLSLMGSAVAPKDTLDLKSFPNFTLSLNLILPVYSLMLIHAP